MTSKSKSNKTNSPEIIIDIPPILEAFCRLQFKIQDSEKSIRISRKHPIGKIINSNRSSTNIKPAILKMINPVKFILPVNPNNQHSLLYSFHYVTNDQQQQIRDAIDYEYKKWCYEFFKWGYKYKFTQKEIIDAILRGLNKRKNIANSDSIKKNDFRTQKNEDKKRFKMLLNLIE